MGGIQSHTICSGIYKAFLPKLLKYTWGYFKTDPDLSPSFAHLFIVLRVLLGQWGSIFHCHQWSSVFVWCIIFGSTYYKYYLKFKWSEIKESAHFYIELLSIMKLIKFNFNGVFCCFLNDTQNMQLWIWIGWVAAYKRLKSFIFYISMCMWATFIRMYRLIE